MPAMGTDTKLSKTIANVSSVDRGKGRYNKRPVEERISRFLSGTKEQRSANRTQRILQLSFIEEARVCPDVRSRESSKCGTNSLGRIFSYLKY